MASGNIEENCKCFPDAQKSGRQLVILRGPPGCGKSMFALNLLAQELDVGIELLRSKEKTSWVLSHICSTDDFFMGECEQDVTQFYEFDRSLLSKHHALNEQRVGIAMQLGISPIVVDNTNMQLWEMRGYAEHAVRHGYSVEVVHPQRIDPSWNDTAHLLMRNAGRIDVGKNVPLEVVRKMLSHFEAFHGNLQEILAASRLSPESSQADTISEGMEEYRVDVADGCAYTLEDFIIEYGGSHDLPPPEWDAAAKAKLPRRQADSSRSWSRSRSRSRSLSQHRSENDALNRSQSYADHASHAKLQSSLSLHRMWPHELLDQWPRWRDRLTKEYCLNVQEDEHLCILSADQSLDWSKQSAHDHDILKQNRGSIYEKKSGRAVCVPFFKFWNHGERYADPIDWHTAVAEEKIDGNLMKLFFFDGRWRLASNRTLNVHEHNDKYSCTGRSNYELFAEAAANSGLNYDRLDAGCCYMFERVHPDFRIVLEYPEPLLYHIGTRDMKTMEELDTDVGVQKPRQWKVRSAAECQSVLDSIPGFVEGFVVRDSLYRRQKWKRRDYVALHSARMYVGSEACCHAWVARCARAATMDVHRLCLNVWLRQEESEFRAYFPETRAEYSRVTSILEAEGFVDAALAGDVPVNVRQREPGTGRFVFEERLYKDLKKRV